MKETEDNIGCISFTILAIFFIAIIWGVFWFINDLQQTKQEMQEIKKKIELLPKQTYYA